MLPLSGLIIRVSAEWSRSLTYPRSIASMAVERAWRNERIRRLIAYRVCLLGCFVIDSSSRHSAPYTKRIMTLAYIERLGIQIGSWSDWETAVVLRVQSIAPSLPYPRSMSRGRRWMVFQCPVSLIFILSLTLYFVCSSNIPSDPHRAGLSARH